MVQKSKLEALDLISQSYKAFVFEANLLKYSANLKKCFQINRNLFLQWNSKNMFKVFKHKIQIIIKLQRMFRSTMEKRNRMMHLHYIPVIESQFVLYQFRHAIQLLKKMIRFKNRFKAIFRYKDLKRKR